MIEEIVRGAKIHLYIRGVVRYKDIDRAGMCDKKEGKGEGEREREREREGERERERER